MADIDNTVLLISLFRRIEDLVRELAKKRLRYQVTCLTAASTLLVHIVNDRIGRFKGEDSYLIPITPETFELLSMNPVSMIRALETCLSSEKKSEDRLLIKLALLYLNKSQEQPTDSEHVEISVKMPLISL